MTDEEMEITTDFGHLDPVEDIDIDFDFTTEQPDGDLELEDFDQAQFHSDPRDELMAEGDDGSYDMVDADEANYNNTAAAANDYGIDATGTDGNVWQASNAPMGSERDGPTEEATHHEIIGADSFGADQANPNDGLWVRDGDHAGNNTVLETAQTVEPSLPSGDDPATLASLTAADFSVVNEGFGLGAPEVGPDVDLDLGGVDEVGLTEFNVGNTLAEASTTDDPLNEPSASTAGDSNSGVEQGTTGTKTTDVGETLGLFEDPGKQDHQDLNGEEEDAEIGYTQLDDDEHLSQEGDVSLAPEETEHGRNDAQEHQPVFQVNPEWTDGAADMSAGLYQLGDDSYGENTNNNQHDPEEATEQDEEEHGSLVSSTYGPRDDSNVEHDDTAVSDSRRTQDLTDEHPLSIATRHEIFMRYGETDYRLFAKSENDDPNTYFLGSDMYAMELPLNEFLKSIREVISQEVSPLDELVMHVGVLGLKFGETMTGDFLEKTTFGDILTVYDKLVKNSDDLENTPDLYIYLMVRPNCSQRFAALVDQAKSGRSLNDVAVYRDETPAQKGDLVVLPDEGKDEDIYSAFEEGPPEEQERADNEDEEDDETGPALAPDVENLEGLTKEPVADGDDDDLIDYDASDLFLPEDDQTGGDPFDDDVTQPNLVPASDGETIPTSNGPAEEAASRSTSATVTVNGDDKDEIDYSDDEDVDTGGGGVNVDTVAPTEPPKSQPKSPAKSKLPVDDEITWESENDDTPATSKESVQVSPAAIGKRSRSDYDTADGVDDKKDVKRRRS